MKPTTPKLGGNRKIKGPGKGQEIGKKRDDNCERKD
jgi:hypothetical protein